MGTKKTKPQQAVEEAYQLINSLYKIKVDDIAPIYNALYNIVNKQLEFDYERFQKIVK